MSAMQKIWIHSNALETTTIKHKANAENHKEEDWQLWSTKLQVHGTAKGYGDILEGKISVPTADKLSKLTGKQNLQSAKLICPFYCLPLSN